MLKLPLFSILDIDHCNLAEKEVVDASKLTPSALSGQLVRFNTQILVISSRVHEREGGRVSNREYTMCNNM